MLCESTEGHHFVSGGDWNHTHTVLGSPSLAQDVALLAHFIVILEICK